LLLHYQLAISTQWPYNFAAGADEKNCTCKTHPTPVRVCYCKTPTSSELALEAHQFKGGLLAPRQAEPCCAPECPAGTYFQTEVGKFEGEQCSELQTMNAAAGPS
jgi:hypothetical protein